jgi:hypothetical protein
MSQSQALAVFSAQPPASVPTQANTNPVFLNFYDRRSEMAAEVKAILGEIADGTAYLTGGALTRPVRFEHRIIGLHGHLYAAKRSAADYSLQKVGTFPATEDGYKDEAILAALLVGPKGEVLTCLSTIRATKTPIVSQLESAIAASTASDWAGNDEARKRLTKVPARLRVCIHRIAVKAKTSKKTGHPYVVAQPVVQTTPLDDVAAVTKFVECNQDAMKRLEALYTEKLAELQAKA